MRERRQLVIVARALGRRKEIAIRAALGASRWTLTRQLLTESRLLAVVSGCAGMLLGVWGTRVLSTIAGSPISGAGSIGMDFRVLPITAAISLVSGVPFGSAPALLLARPDPNSVLRDEGRGSTGGRSRNRARNLLVVAQVALSVILLVGSGLLIRSFIRLRSASPGFDPRNVLTMQMALPPTRYATRPQMINFYNQTLEKIRAIPGVQNVAISSALPLNPSRFAPMLVEGQPQVPVGQRPLMNLQAISPDYPATRRVPLLRGRGFSQHDDAQAPMWRW